MCIHNIDFVESKGSLLSGLIIVAILGACYNPIANAIIGSPFDWLCHPFSGYLIGVPVVLPISFKLVLVLVIWSVVVNVIVGLLAGIFVTLSIDSVIFFFFLLVLAYLYLLLCLLIGMFLMLI